MSIWIGSTHLQGPGRICGVQQATGGGCYEQLSGIIDGKSHHINYQHLVMLLSGISLVGLHQRPRYEMKKQDNFVKKSE
ncbi:MAG: hypothetical protein IPO37_17725 [Saprospiraceae bacterium]|nr:hypothetical protein [Saprospiraceae bacterium]